MTDQTRELPYTLLSCGMSLDGFLDSPGDQRLLLSNDADFDRVDEVRAGCDAILVGAATVRKDNPRLVVRAADRRERRVARGLTPSPRKVTVTRGGRLDPRAAFFTAGPAEKLVYCAGAGLPEARDRLGGVATVVEAAASDDPARVDLGRLGSDLAARGVGRLMVEGGGTIHTQYLTSGLADELHLVVAPFFVGDSRAARFVGEGRFPWNPDRPARLVDVRRLDDVVLLRYALSPRFDVEGEP